MDIDGLSMLKSSSSSSWVNRGGGGGGEEGRRGGTTAAAVNREHGESGNAAPMHRRWMHRRKRRCRRIVPARRYSVSIVTMRERCGTIVEHGMLRWIVSVARHCLTRPPPMSIRTHCEPLYRTQSADDDTEWWLPVSTF